jgi:hypothetical protein
MMKLHAHLRSGKMQATYVALLALLLCAIIFSFRHVEVSDLDDPSHGLFPLVEGTTWVYRVETEMNDPTIEETLTLSVDRKIDFENKLTWVRRSADGAEYYIQRDESGIYRVARRTDFDELATKDANPRYVLKMPLQVGDFWDGGTTVPYLIRRPNQVPNDLKQSHRANMTYRVVALNEEVVVPVAKYTGCVHLIGEASIRIFTDPINGFNDVPLVTNEWYCPKVGLVKFSREEIVPGQFMTGGKVTYQLTDQY